MSKTFNIAKELISKKSITPNDAGCQDLLIKHLTALGFSIENMDHGDVKNFYAKRGKDSPLITFAGHTDVVPPGPEDKWLSPPFAPTVNDNKLYGRGAADMKSSLAAFIVSIEEFIADNPNHPGSIALLITSDEEGVAIDGTVKVIETLKNRNEKSCFSVYRFVCFKLYKKRK